MASGMGELLQRIVRVFEDTIADSAKVREGLTDDEAIPLVDWGVAYAKTLATRMVSGNASLPGEQQISDQAYNLTRLMTRLNWVVTYRDKKDADWLTQTMLMANKLSQDLLGPSAPVMAEDKIAGWLAAQRKRPTKDILQELMAYFAPPTPGPASGPPGGALSTVLGAAFSAPADLPEGQNAGSGLLGSVIDSVLGEGQSSPPAQPAHPSPEVGSGLLGSVIDSVLGEGQSSPPAQPDHPFPDAGPGLLGAVIDSVLGGDTASRLDGASPESDQAPGPQKEKLSKNPLNRLFSGRPTPGRGSTAADSPDLPDDDSETPRKR